MSKKKTLTFHITAAAKTETHASVEELRSVILGAIPDATFVRRRRSPKRGGTDAEVATLSMTILEVGATLGVAAAVRRWLDLRKQSSLVVEVGGKRLMVSHGTYKDPAKLADRMVKLMASGLEGDPDLDDDPDSASGTDSEDRPDSINPAELEGDRDVMDGDPDLDDDPDA